jgi:hypothetical protein
MINNATLPTTTLTLTKRKVMIYLEICFINKSHLLCMFNIKIIFYPINTLKPECFEPVHQVSF